MIQTNQGNDVVMIDLTQDTPKTLSKEASFAKNKPPVTTIITKCSLPDPERLEKLPRLIFPSPVPHLPRNSFTPLLHHRQDRVPQGPSSGLGSGHAPPRRITGMRHFLNVGCTQHSLRHHFTCRPRERSYSQSHFPQHI